MLNTLPEVLLKKVLDSFTIGQLSTLRSTCRFFNAFITQEDFLRNEINQTSLNIPLKNWLIEPRNPIQIIQRWLLADKTMASVSNLSGDKFKEMLISSITMNQLFIILHSYPEKIVTFLEETYDFEESESIYQSILPNYALFSLIEQHSHLAMAFLLNPQLHAFISAGQYIRYFYLLARNHEEVVMAVLSDSDKNSFIIAQEDFIYLVRAHEAAYTKINREPVLQTIMGSNYQSLLFSIALKASLNPKNPVIIKRNLSDSPEEESKKHLRHV